MRLSSQLFRKSLTTPNVSSMYYNGQSQILLVEGFIGMALKKDACYRKLKINMFYDPEIPLSVYNLESILEIGAKISLLQCRCPNF